MKWICIAMQTYSKPSIPPAESPGASGLCNALQARKRIWPSWCGYDTGPKTNSWDLDDFEWFQEMHPNPNWDDLGYFREIQINIYSFPCSHWVYHMVSYVPQADLRPKLMHVMIHGSQHLHEKHLQGEVLFDGAAGDGWELKVRWKNVYDLSSISKYQPIDDQHSLCLCPANALQEEWTLQRSKAEVGQTVCKQSYLEILGRPVSQSEPQIKVCLIFVGFDWTWFLYSKSSACASLDWLALGTLALLATLATSQFELTFFCVLRTAPG